MFMFRKVFLVLFLTVCAFLASGCVAIGAGVGLGLSESFANDLTGIIEVGDVKTNGNVNITTIKGVMVSSVVFNKDMTMLNETPRPNDIKVNVAVAEEMKRITGVYTRSSKATILLKVYYDNTRPIDWYYRSVTEKGTLGLFQSAGIRKLINVHLLLEQDGNTLLEVRGLWISGNPGDEIAGARQLAKEMANAVLKKLNSPASRKASIAEAKKE